MGTPTTTTMIQTQMQPSLSISTASAAAAATTSGSAALRSRPATPVLTTTPSPMDDGNEPFYARGGSEQHVIHDYFSKGAHFVDRSGSTRQLSDPGANGRARIAKADRSSGSSGAQHDHHHHHQQQQHRRPQKDAKASQHGSPTRALSLGHGRSSSVAATGGSRSRSPAATAAAQSSTSTSHSSYGGILSSRPSSRASRPSSPRASTSADEDGRLRLTRVSSRPSARSPAVLQQQHHPHHHAGASSPLLADMHDRRLSTSHHQNHSHAGHLRRHSLASGIARAHLALGRTKASLGIGTGEWTDSRTGRWRTPERLRAYIPLVVWVIVSVVMALVVAVWHEQVFSGLDSLSTYLKAQGLFGDSILFSCIFLTTFPPLPMYSTFIFLAGYSYGLLHGFILSYLAALSGAVVVFALSKIWLKGCMCRLLDKSPSLKKVIRAVERRPKLLFLIRLSPYPYNVMNTLLASSQTLSFSCYFWCTAIANLKLLVHVSVGCTIRSFAQAGGAGEAVEGATEEELEREQAGQRMKAIAGAVGVLLCIGVFVYLLRVARRAVDDVDDCDRLPSFDSDASALRSRSSSTATHNGDSSQLPLLFEHDYFQSHPARGRADTGEASEMREVATRSSIALDRGVFADPGLGNGASVRVQQRHAFERQNTGFAVGAGAGAGAWQHGHTHTQNQGTIKAKLGAEEEFREDIAESEGELLGFGLDALGRSRLVADLEQVAHERSMMPRQ